MARSLPIIFGQQDYLQQLGTSGGSIKEWGCKLVTGATLAKACGKEIDPIELNKVYIQKRVYVEGKYLADDSLTKVFPDIIYQKSYEFTNSPADLNLLKELVKDPTNWVIIRIKIPPPYNTHFALVTGVNGVITIANPLSKKNEDFAQQYGDPASNITKFILYKGNPAVGNEEALVAKQTEANINWNVVLNITALLGVRVDPDNKSQITEQVRRRIEEYATEIGVLKEQVREWKDKYEKERNRVIETKNINSKIEGSDANFAEEARQAEHKVEELKHDMEKIGEALQLSYDPSDDKKLVEQILSEVKNIRDASSNTDDAEIKVLKKLIKVFIEMGINNYLKTQNLEILKEDDTDDEVYRKITLYLSDLVEEFLRLEKPQNDVLSDKPFKETLVKAKQNPVVRFIKSVLGVFIYAE